MPAKPAPKKFVWVGRSGRGWLLQMELIEQLLMPSGIVVAAAGGLLKITWLVGTGIAMVALSFLLFAVVQFLLFRIVRCPHCGANPMRNKQTRKRINHRIARARLRELTECPECHQ